jgi:glycosyltransferase 2 family protein
VGEAFRRVNGRARKIALTTLQVAVTLGILWWVFRDPAKRGEMRDTLGSASLPWMLGGFAIYGLLELVAGIRWQILMRVQGLSLGWGRLYALLLIGVFFNFFIPGGTGGDVVKAYFLLKETPGRRAPAVLATIMDRLSGLFGLVVLAGVIIALRWDWLTATPDTARAVWTTLAILAASFAGIAFSFVLTGFGLVHRLPERFPMRDRLAEIALAYNLYGRAWRPSLWAFLLSIIAHIGYFAVYHFAAASFSRADARIPGFYDLCSVMTVVNTITALPISIGGVGVREGLFQIFLGQLSGVSDAVAVVISSTGFLLTAAWGLIGGVVYLFYRPSEHARLREIRASVAEVEHVLAEREMAMEIKKEDETPKA